MVSLATFFPLSYLVIMVVASSSHGLQSPVSVKIDTNDWKNSIEGWIRNAKPGERRGFVKGLMEMMAFKTKDTGYHVMVYNINQEYRNGLLDVVLHEQVKEYDSTFGIWVFKCGTFMNKGDRGWHNWAYTGRFVNFGQGNGVIFTHPDCPQPAYRQNQYIELADKDYHMPTTRQFYAVESVFECYAWAVEIDANMAVYDSQARVCHAKPTDLVGTTYDSRGNSLGNWDPVQYDKAVTKDINDRNRWFNTRECDAIHSRDGTHWCKSYAHNPGRYLILRKRQ